MSSRLSILAGRQLDRLAFSERVRRRPSEATVPLSAVRSVDLRGRRVANGALVVALPARRRVDVLLELAEPVTVGRALAAPVETCRPAIAADDPELLAAASARPALAQGSSPRRTASISAGAARPGLRKPLTCQP